MRGTADQIKGSKELDAEFNNIKKKGRAKK